MAETMELTGTVIDQAYRVLAKRQESADAEIYCGEPIASGPPVAIAFIREKLGHGDPAEEAFEREGRALCRFTHPGVAEVFDCGVFNGMPYVVTALPVGEKLAAELESLRAAPDRALKAISGAYEAIEAAHAAGLAHGALGKSSFILTPEGRLMIVDLAIVRLRGAIVRARRPSPEPSKSADITFVTGLTKTFFAPVEAPKPVAAPKLVAAPKPLVAPFVSKPARLPPPAPVQQQQQQRQRLPSVFDDLEEPALRTTTFFAAAGKEAASSRTLNLIAVCVVFFLMWIVLKT
jgi:serine/threonine protein kinase